MPYYRGKKCCCPEGPCEAGVRFAKIKPVMLPNKFMGTPHPLRPSKISFWVRYNGTCPSEKEKQNENDVVIRQRLISGDEEEERVIRIGDTSTKFMTDCGPRSIENSIEGMYEPGTNQRYICRTLVNSEAINDHSEWQSGSHFMEYLGGGSNEANRVAFSMWHRNCFTLDTVIGGVDGERPFLTQEEWLDLDEHRIVFRNSQTTTPGDEPFSTFVDVDGVHIFNNERPFAEYDCVPYKYSPILHLIPSDVVGAFYSGGSPSDPASWRVVYDYQELYPDQVGANVGAGGWGNSIVKNNVCDTIRANDNATWPARTYFASAMPLPNDTSVLPFNVSRRFVCPDASWDVPIPTKTQVFVDAGGQSCDELDTDIDCTATEFCHGSQDLAEYYAYGAMGSINAFSVGRRFVDEGNPLRNNLFVCSVLSVIATGREAYGVYLSSTDSFPGNYQLFTGATALAIKNLQFGPTNLHNIGYLNFGSGSAAAGDMDPNPNTAFDETDPGGPREFSTNFSNEFGPPYNCGCAEANYSVINYEAQQGWGASAQGASPSGFIQLTPGWVTVDSFDGRDDVKGDDRAISLPQLSIP